MRLTGGNAQRLLLVTSVLSTASLFAGCGGASTNGNLPGINQPTAGPVIYGVYTNGLESSGLASSDRKTGYVTGVTASTAKPLAALGGLTLGFAPGGQYADRSFGAAAPAGGGNVVFGVNISNGVGANRSVVPINPSSVVLTSSEAPGFSQAMSFNGSAIGTGPLANAQYYTASFTLPFSTTGLHSLTASVADTSGQLSSTTFAVAVVAASDSAVVAQLGELDPNTGSVSPVAGATATITNPVSGATAQAVADSQGVVVLFAAPGPETITVTPPAGDTDDQVTSDTQTLTAGQAFTSFKAPGSGPTDPPVPYFIDITKS